MSELKVYNTKYEQVLDKVYIKSEADEVISKLEDDCAYLKTMAQKNADDNAVMAKQRAEALKRECHQKYKLCLAMAKEWSNYAAFCGMQSSCHNHRGFGKTAEKWTWKECHAWKCVKRWRELAEKFKQRNNDG